MDAKKGKTRKESTPIKGSRWSSWPEALGKEGVTGTLVPVQEGRLRRFGLSEETPVPALRDGVSFQSVFGQMTECY